VELIPDGANVLVTDENKVNYVKRVATFRLYEAIKPQMDAFLKGFFSIVPSDLLKIFDNRELELLLSGLPTIDIDDLKENCTYENYTARSKPILFLWAALKELTHDELGEFIQFVTGSSKVPVEGFKGLRGSNGLCKFKIVKVQGGGKRLP